MEQHQKQGRSVARWKITHLRRCLRRPVPDPVPYRIWVRHAEDRWRSHRVTPLPAGTGRPGPIVRTGAIVPGPGDVRPLRAARLHRASGKPRHADALHPASGKPRHPERAASGVGRATSPPARCIGRPATGSPRRAASGLRRTRRTPGCVGRSASCLSQAGYVGRPASRVGHPRYGRGSASRVGHPGYVRRPARHVSHSGYVGHPASHVGQPGGVRRHARPAVPRGRAHVNTVSAIEFHGVDTP